MANLKDIVATLAILSAGTLTLTGCKKDGGETTNPDEVKAGDSAGDAAGDAGGGDDAAAGGEGDAAGGEGEASCSGAGGEGEASCSGGEGEAAPPAE